MKTPLMPTNDWRTSPIVASEPNEGLFAPQEPVFPPAQGCEVVSCEEPEYNSLPFGEEIHEVSQPTTYNPSEEEIEESIDLNDINPDPNALPPFPIWGLPEIVRKMSEQGAKVYGVPAAFFVMYILCAIGAVLKKKVQLIMSC